MYEDTKDVWLIGKWLSWPFWFLSVYFNVARDKSWEADQDLVYAITWVKGLVDGNVIGDILEKIWFEFSFLKRDPIGWVRAKIDEVSGELRFLRLDPMGWMRSRVYFAFPVFHSLLGNSGWWVYNELNKRYPEIGSFIRDTWGFIRGKVLSLFWWARELETNPTRMIIDRINAQVGWFWSFMQNPSDFIVNRFASYNYLLHQMLTDPNRWVKDRMATVLGINPNEMDNLVVTLIKRMFSAVLGNQSGLLDYTKEAIVSLILRFI